MTAADAGITVMRLWTPAIIRLKWAADTDMSQALRVRISELPKIRGLMWEPVSVSALSNEVVVLVVLKRVTGAADDRA